MANPMPMVSRVQGRQLLELGQIDARNVLSDYVDVRKQDRRDLEGLRDYV